MHVVTSLPTKKRRDINIEEYLCKNRMTVMTQKKVSMREKKACCYVNVGWCFYTP
jgi:hypothetical protein